MKIEHSSSRVEKPSIFVPANVNSNQGGEAPKGVNFFRIVLTKGDNRLVHRRVIRPAAESDAGFCRKSAS